MISEAEYYNHSQHTMAPIDAVWVRENIKKIKKLVKGTLIWVSAEGYRTFPVKFISLHEHERGTNIIFEYIYDGLIYQKEVYHYNFIRPCSKKEILELEKELKNKLNFLSLIEEIK